MAAAAAVWLTIALTTGGPGGDEWADDADRPSTTRVEARTRWVEPTSTTAEVIPGGPLLGEPSGLRLVAVTDNGSRVIDLDTGAVTRVDRRVLSVADRRLVVRGDGIVAVWPHPYDGSSSTTIAEIPADRVVEQVWVVGDGTLVWLLQQGPGFGAGPAPATAVLVDLAGRTLARFELPGGFSPSGAVDRGLVVSGPGGIYVLGTDGAAERISTGDVWTVADNQVLAFNCDERLECGLEVFDGRGQRLNTGAIDPLLFDEAVAAPDGRIAYVVHPDPNRETSQVTVDGVPVFEAPGEQPPLGGLAWSPDGRWLAILASDGIHLIDTLRGKAPVVVPMQPWSFNGYNHFSFG
ncbi:MAG TPA: hypothetical protein VJM33_12750 [Microthrixaceae bacterium]|nr:hypothetical protein [Microthrixaceae bacterium]